MLDRLYAQQAQDLYEEVISGDIDIEMDDKDRQTMIEIFTKVRAKQIQQENGMFLSKLYTLIDEEYDSFASEEHSEMYKDLARQLYSMTLNTYTKSLKNTGI
jgi:hypothetical protein